MKKIVGLLKKHSKIYIVLIFVVFYMFLLLQYSRVFLYSDDYGYGSLRYAVTPTKDGIWGFFEYLYLHYMNWGGRILYYSVLILGTKAGLWVIRLLVCTVVFVDFWLIYKIVTLCCVHLNKVIVSIITCCMYGVFSVAVASQSLYWYSAAITYLLPFMTINIFFLSLLNKNKEKVSTRELIILVLLAFVAGFSQEQYSIVACFAYALFFIVHVKDYDRMMKLQYAIIGIALVIGSVILILAPGNYNRSVLAESESLSLNIIIMRLDNILNMVFNSTMKYYIIFLSVALLLSVLAEWKNKTIRKRLITVPYIVFFCFILFIYMKQGYFIGIGENPLYLEVLKWLYYPIVISGLVIINLKKTNMVSVYMMLGIMSGLVMVATSEVSPRTMVPLILFCLPYIISVYAGTKMPFYIDRAVVAGICIVAVLNIYIIYQGYDSNYSINKMNWIKLSVASYEQPECIYLYKNIDDKYSYVQPYMYDGFFEGQESLMKYYFDLEQSIDIDWVEAVE